MTDAGEGDMYASNKLECDAVSASLAASRPFQGSMGGSGGP